MILLRIVRVKFFFVKRQTIYRLKNLKIFLFDITKIISREEQDTFDIGGGMGGEFDLITFKDAKDDPWYKDWFRDLDDPQNYLFIYTDQCHYATIKWIRENLNIVYSDY